MVYFSYALECIFFPTQAADHCSEWQMMVSLWCTTEGGRNPCTLHS